MTAISTSRLCGQMMEGLVSYLYQSSVFNCGRRRSFCDCFASWVLGRTIEMDKLFPLDSKERGSPMIVGFAEENNVALMWTEGSLFMFQLESLQLKKLMETRISFYQPFESVYTAGNSLLYNLCITKESLFSIIG